MKRPAINKKVGFAGSWVVSANEDEFSSRQFCSRTAAVKNGARELELDEDAVGSTGRLSFYVGKVVSFPRVLDLGDARRVLEESGERSECCDSVYERMSNQLRAVETEAERDLSRVLSAWLRRWGLHPNQHGYNVESIECVEAPKP